MSARVTRWRLRVCYAKTGRLRFISHLDFIRTFERAARRARLPLAFTEGYSPAPKIAYGWPLPVGVAGLAEYLDLALTERLPPGDVVERLNRALPEGLWAREARYLTPHGPSLMAELDTGAYLTRFPAGGRGLGEWRAAAERLLSRESLRLRRERGPGPEGRAKAKVVDVRPLVRRVEVREVGGSLATVIMELELSERGTARPEEVAGLLWQEVTGAGPETAAAGGAGGAEAGAASPVAAPRVPEGWSAVRLGLRREGGPSGPPGRPVAGQGGGG